MIFTLYPPSFYAVFVQERDRLRLSLDGVNRAVAGLARQLERDRAGARTHVPDRVGRSVSPGGSPTPTDLFLGHRHLSAREHFISNRFVFVRRTRVFDQQNR